MTLTKKVVSLVGSALVVAALTPGFANANTGGTERPYLGSDTGTITLTLTSTTTGYFETTRSGWATHIGKYTVFAEGSGAFSIENGEKVFIASGTWTITAASGDELFGTLTSTAREFTETGHTATTLFTITGGSGRFEGASGTVTGIDRDTTISFVPPVLVNSTESAYSGQVSY